MPSVLKTSNDQKMKLMGSWSLPSKNLTDSWKKSKRKQTLKMYMNLYCCIRCSMLFNKLQLVEHQWWIIILNVEFVFCLFNKLQYTCRPFAAQGHMIYVMSKLRGTFKTWKKFVNFICDLLILCPHCWG